MSHTRTVFFSMSIILLVCIYALQFGKSLPQMTVSTSLEKENDLRVHHLSVHVFNTLGEQTHTLKSPLLEHNEDKQIHRLYSPLIHITETGKPNWDISADEAHIEERLKEIVLLHHVTLKHAPFKTYAKGVIETEELHYFPSQSYAMTETEIKWHQMQNTLFSQGMKAFLKQNQIQLFKVKARYDSSL